MTTTDSRLMMMEGRRTAVGMVDRVRKTTGRSAVARSTGVPGVRSVHGSALFSNQISCSSQRCGSTPIQLRAVPPGPNQSYVRQDFTNCLRGGYFRLLINAPLSLCRNGQSTTTDLCMEIPQDTAITSSMLHATHNSIPRAATTALGLCAAA